MKTRELHYQEVKRLVEILKAEASTSRKYAVGLPELSREFHRGRADAFRDALAILEEVMNPRPASPAPAPEGGAL